MTILITALLIALLLLSKKYILKLEPVGVFAAMWIFLISVILCCQNFVIVKFTGLLFIIACVFSFNLGVIFCETYYNPLIRKEKELIFKEKRACIIMLLLFFAAFINPIYTITLHGFSPLGIFNIGTLLQMNNVMSIDRYAGSEHTSTLNQVLLVFSYTAPLVGGFCYRLVNRGGKVLSMLSIIPCLFVAFTQSVKMGFITSVFLWVCGMLTCSYTYHLSLKIKPKYIFITAGGSILFLGLLFLSMMLRTGELSYRIAEDISNKFFTYAFGYVPCFDIWYDYNEVSEYTYGAKTLFGISNALGFMDRIQGIYHEWIPFGKGGFKGESNVFTLFRILVEDFGPSGSCLVMILLGGVSNIVTKNLEAKKNIYFNQIVLSAIYSFVMWSFVTSFFAYTSYLVMFVFVYFIWNSIQCIEYKSKKT